MKILKTFKVAVCGCNHSWTTKAEKPRCSACEKRLRKKKEAISTPSDPTKMMEETGHFSDTPSDPPKIMEETAHPITVYHYWAIRNPFK